MKQHLKNEQIRDYLMGKYLRLIYLCLYHVESGNERLLRDTLKYCYFYVLSRIDSTIVESLPVDYLEQHVRLPSVENQDEEERKKQLIQRFKQ